MTRSKNYKTGKTTCKAYLKPVGMGWEVGFTFDSRPIFVGNFIHPTEASAWYALMNREIRGFSRRYKVGPKFPKPWYGQFLRTHLYSTYYRFLDRMFSKYQRNYRTDFNQNVRKYEKMSKGWRGEPRVPALKVA